MSPAWSGGAVLGIETSCDETSAAVIRDGRVLGHVILSQDAHERFGGVVPEIAARAHLRQIDTVVNATLEEAGVERGELGGVGVTAGPGLVGGDDGNDLTEINVLNHYIGMRPLEEAAKLERSVSVFAIAALALLVVAAIFVHTRWVVLLVLPAILMPVVFLLDLQYWLRDFGLNLDETAALSSAIDPFVPKVLGSGMIAQFETVAQPGAGLWLAIAASLLCIAGLYFHRKAYKPLVESQG